MTPSEVQSAEDMRGIVEERGAKNVTIAMSDMHGLLRGKYISRDKLLSVLENGWGMPPLILALDFDDIIMQATEDLGRLCRCHGPRPARNLPRNPLGIAGT